MFGLRSLDELKLSILINRKPTGPIPDDAAPLSSNSFWRTRNKVPDDAATQFSKILISAAESLGGKSGSSLLGISAHKINKTIVCIDDFERTNWQQIPVDLLLGFINFLKIEKKCSVVLIFNSDELGEGKDAYRKFREKVIDSEVSLRPTAAEISELIFDKNSPDYNLILEHVSKLNVSNIRICRRMRTLIDLILNDCGKMHPQVKAQIIIAVILFCWAEFDSGAARPTIEFLKSFNVFRSMGEDEATEKPSESALWSSILKRYGFMSFDELDLEVLNIVQHGHTEGTGIKNVIADYNEKLAQSDLGQEFQAAWRLFHDSLRDDKEQLVNRLNVGIKSGAKGISPGNLDGAVSLLRDLGESALADQLIDCYVAERANERRLFDLSSHPFGGEIKDPYLRRVFDAQLTHVLSKLSLKEAALVLLAGGEDLNEARTVLLAAPVDHYIEMLKSDFGDQLHAVCGELLRYRDVHHYSTIGTKSEEALRQISKENRLNALRLARHKLEK